MEFVASTIVLRVHVCLHVHIVHVVYYSHNIPSVRCSGYLYNGFGSWRSLMTYMYMYMYMYI